MSSLHVMSKSWRSEEEGMNINEKHKDHGFAPKPGKTSKNNSKALEVDFAVFFSIEIVFKG
jgi:hypothetical protein